MDTNGDGMNYVDDSGMLSREELIVGYTKILENEELAKIEVDKIIEIVDINKSG